MHYIEIPASVVKKLGGFKKQRLHCTINKQVSYPCGLMALGEGRAYVSINKKRMTELKLKVGDAIEVLLEPDHSRFGMEVPEELEELLKQDPEGEARFLKLSAGKQRNIIYYVSGVKSSQLRIERSLKLINHLKQLPEGKEKVREIFLGPGM
ncbi:MAG: DUF1905 domain-containing protein [Bacteroidia bacterium]|nr:DUF1905 domain-containing protein [Bacteroidia bacterium]